jgi:hypothetical protein
VEAYRVVKRQGSCFFLDNRLIDGCEVLSLTRLPSFSRLKLPGTHFCARFTGHRPTVQLEGFEKLNNLMFSLGNESRDLQASSIVSLPTRLLGYRVPADVTYKYLHPTA